MIGAKWMRSLIVFILMLFAANVWAVSSSLWEIDSMDDFEKGEPDGVSILASGDAILGPKADVTSLDALYAWTLAEDSSGNIYAGTGSDGKIFKISPKGSIEVFAELELQQVFAIVAGEADTIYAGGFPGGKIYSIDSQGVISEYFDTAQDAIWSLCVGDDGTIFAATGDKGQIFRVRTGGQGEMLYDSAERRILSLLCDGQGNLYAGSEPNGIVYRFDKSGRPSVVYDTELEEVTSMAMDMGGNLYVVSAPGELFMRIPPQVVPGIPPAAAAAARVGIQAPAQPAIASGAPAIPSPRKRTCIIYKITKEEAASKFWTSPEKLVFAIIFDGSDLLAGTGDDGIVYRISPDGEASTYFKADQKQVIDLHRSRDGSIIAAFGNEAGIVRFEDGHAEEGEYVSQVHDAVSVSSWGRVFWEAELPAQTDISLSTRSGNSETPDDTWSEWSREHSDADGFVTDSPIGRYIQCRVTLRTADSQKTPTLHKITVAYLQTNLAPVVESVNIGTDSGKQNKMPAGADLAEKLKSLASAAVSGSDQKGGEKPKASADGVKAAAETHETAVKIHWKANDSNDDQLEYAVYFKGVDETRWKLLKDKLSEMTYSWDTEAVPDGKYHVKVVASDSPSNAQGSALSDERVSESFTIDNTPPVVGRLSVDHVRGSKSCRFAATVSDNLSPIRSSQFSVDASEWITVFPADGIFDSLSEDVEFSSNELGEGEHTVVLKTVDYFGNIGSGKITFNVK